MRRVTAAEADEMRSAIDSKRRAAGERMWIAGRALGLRLHGMGAVQASMQATYESQQYQAEEDAK